ncbi:MAG: hypothetical protein SFT90_04740 [Rickettsiales bacterium]|nr:hypothetical protein [Rickettsiales bacterium]
MACENKEHNHENKTSCEVTKKHCNSLRCVLAILAFAVIGTAIAYGVWEVFKSGWNTKELKHMWRPQSAPHWQFMPVAHLFQAIIFVCLYKCLGKALSCCPCPFMRGGKFGFKIWLIASLADAPFWFIAEKINTNVIAISLIDTFLTFVIGGAIASKILGNIWCEEKSECKN